MRRLLAILVLLLPVSAARPRTVELEPEATVTTAGDPFAWVGWAAAVSVTGISLYLSRRQH